jgi:hypothetical protein
MNTALAGNEPTVRQLLDDGAVLAGRLGGMDDQVQSLIGSSDTVLAAYASQEQALRAIIDDLDTLGSKLGGMTGDIDSVLVNFADVQDQLDTLLRENSSNIDATLSSLDSVATNLSRNKGKLATTLCTLPAGAAGYFQTTSWGEWFNVRIVEVMLKDRAGATIAEVPEQDVQHGPSQPPFECGSGGAGATNPGSAPSKGGGSKGKGNGGQSPTETVTHTFQSIKDFLRFVLGGESGA